MDLADLNPSALMRQTLLGMSRNDQLRSVIEAELIPYAHASDHEIELQREPLNLTAPLDAAIEHALGEWEQVEQLAAR